MSIPYYCSFFTFTEKHCSTMLYILEELLILLLVSYCSINDFPPPTPCPLFKYLLLFDELLPSHSYLLLKRCCLPLN